MESNITPPTQYTQVTVDVPQDRVAEFHAFFARFLAGSRGRRRGRRGHPGHGHRRHGCAHRHEPSEQPSQERAQQSEPTVEATEL
jgi:hypothetical protein